MSQTDVSIPQAEPPEGGSSPAPAQPRPAPPPLQWPATSTAEPSTEVMAPIAALGTPGPPPPPPKAGECCPACGAQMAPDQRYCLECGQRRGDPRLPFMDAVVLMDTLVKGPPPAVAAPAKRARRLSPNATLVAGIGTLLLALGVGVLIGHSGSSQGSPASTTPVVVKVPGGGEASAATTKAGSAATTTAGGGGANAKKSLKSRAATGASGQSKGAEEILKPAKGVKLPPPTAKLGEKCSKGTSGCKGGKFTGEFFGG